MSFHGSLGVFEGESLGGPSTFVDDFGVMSWMEEQLERREGEGEGKRV